MYVLNYRDCFKIFFKNWSMEISVVDFTFSDLANNNTYSSIFFKLQNILFNKIFKVPNAVSRKRLPSYFLYILIIYFWRM